MDYRALLKIALPILAALAGAGGGSFVGYEKRDADFERVVTKYRAVKHELAVCIADDIASPLPGDDEPAPVYSEVVVDEPAGNTEHLPRE